MSSAAVILCTCANLLAISQSVAYATVRSEAQSQPKHVAAVSDRGKVQYISHTPDNAFSKTATQDDWHAHGEQGTQWRWIKNDKGDWTRETITDDKAKQADPPGSPETPEEVAGTDTEATKVNEKACVSKTVSIDVYYETRCPGCLLFINKTLEPLWRTPGLKDALNITLITSGNTMTVPVKDISDGYKFFHPDTTGKGWENVQICQHGADECFGNLVQVCAKDVAKDNAQYMELIFHMTSLTIAGYAEENAAYQAIQKSGIDKDKVKACVTTTKGNQLASEAGKVTAALKGRLGTPWVMVAGSHVENQLLANKTLLTESLCSHVCNAPDACASFKGKVIAKAAPSPAPKAADDIFQVLTKEDFVKDAQDRVQVLTNDDFIKVSPEHV